MRPGTTAIIFLASALAGCGDSGSNASDASTEPNIDAALLDAATAVVDASTADAEVPDAETADADLTPKWPAAVNHAVTDFAAGEFGNVTAVGVVGSNVLVSCFNALGERVADSMSVATIDPTRSVKLSVARSWGTDTSAIAIHELEFPPYDGRLSAVFLSATCAVASGPVTLDSERDNFGVVREADVAMDDAGNAVFLYEHQTAGEFRLVSYGLDGAAGAAAVIGAGVCGGGAQSRHHSVNANGDIVVACESSGERSYRRFSASLDAVDANWTAVTGSGPVSFHMFSILMNDTGDFVYWGRGPDANTAILRNYDAEGTLVASADFGSVPDSRPAGQVTADGDFLIALSADGNSTMRVTPAGVVTQLAGVLDYKLDSLDQIYRISGQNITRGSL